jgi:four helix bundle protein
MIKSFEDLIVWQRSRNLVNKVYKTFDGIKDFSFNDQIHRSSISIMSNIAEGSDRNSKLDFRRFLIMARGSANETKSLMYVAKDLGYIPDAEFDAILNEVNEIGKMISGLINKLN